MRPTVFALFFLSGFCGLCYEIVWVRLAMAAFGATTPVVSVVVSVFMGGLAVGAWAGGRWVGPLGRRLALSPLVLYALTEALIAPGAVAVPPLLTRGEELLYGLGEGGSAAYLASSAAVIAAVVLPWAVLMGATFPVMMGFLKSPRAGEEGRGFSYLYLANICGAAVGSLATAFVLIEVYGFRGTLLVAGGMNLLAAALALLLAGRVGFRPPAEAPAAEAAPVTAAPPAAGPTAVAALFATGFLSMGMEVTWARAFGGMLGQSVYGFALILAVYLVATAVGAAVYRETAWRPPAGWLLFAAGGLSLLPLVTMDPSHHWYESPIVGLVLGLTPLCAALGYLTPRLVDEYSGGDPRRAGLAYAANVIGCVLGPLVASYLLLAAVGERRTILLLSLGFTAAGWAVAGPRAGTGRRVAAVAATLAACWYGLVGVYVFNEAPPDPRKVVRTDYSATVVATGQGMQRLLYVNGTSMTVLTPLTKFMVHLPAAHHPARPRSALIICFGMGTSYRSALSWGMQTTVVELTPSVFKSFGYFHADAAEVLRDPNGRMVVDDGRRFLKRTRDGFDVIVLDPPPPISSPGSGMLYSTEFYREAARRLNPGGVLQQWYPHREGFVYQPLLRSIRAVFPHTRVFVGVGGGGTHVLASMDPLPALTPEAFAARLPPAAAADLVEWPPAGPVTHEVGVRAMFATASPVERHLTGEDDRELTDDRPLNEYYFLREGLQMTAPPERQNVTGP